MAMQLEEVIIEEREEDLMEESSTDNIYHVIPPNQVRNIMTVVFKGQIKTILIS